MEENGDGDELPFWIQTTTNRRRVDRLRSGVSAFFFSSGLVVFILLVIAVFFFIFVVPTTLSFSAQIFRPNSIKKSWDSLNIVLVLVAVVFGFLSRNKNEDRYSYDDEFQAASPVTKQNEEHKSSPSTLPNNWRYNYEEQKSNSSQWYEYSDYQSKMKQKNSVLGRNNYPSTSANPNWSQWYDDSDYYQNKLEQKHSTLRRNSSSYPDLREFSSVYGDYQRRSYDDIQVHEATGVSDPAQQLHRRHRSLEEVEHLRAPPQIKTVIVDTLLSKSKEATNFPLPETVPETEEHSGNEGSSVRLNTDLEQMTTVTAKKPPPAPPPLAQPLPPPPESTNPRRRKERFSRKENIDLESTNPITEPPQPPPPETINQRRRKERSSRKQNKDPENTNPITTLPQSPPPPPPPPPEQKSIKSERKRGTTTGNATKDFLNSLYLKKKKKQRQKSVDNLDSLLHAAQPPLTFHLPPPSPPPPPPPPPPPSVFQNLFTSKKHKRKRTITVTLTPHPQPKPNPQITPSTAQKPPKIGSFGKSYENSNSGGESPFNRIPPPPPPPPPAFFKSPAWKFVVQGDYVRVNSNTSSRSGSPELEETDTDVTPSSLNGGDATPFHPSPLYCPSPDVNTKAESFITNFRAKLKLEKVHSIKNRDVGLGPSGLGPSRI